MGPPVLEIRDGQQTRLKILPTPFISSSTFFTPTPFEKFCLNVFQWGGPLWRTNDNSAQSAVPETPEKRASCAHF
jgi:hypothetical protein